MALGDANCNECDANRHCSCYRNCGVATALEFASGHLETEAKSVNKEPEPRVATGLDLRNGDGGRLPFPASGSVTYQQKPQATRLPHAVLHP